MKQRFIEGIYNYCDRWCERCHFTCHCRNYESTSQLKPGQLDINNKAFWEHISSNFTKAINFLHKMAEERGIDLIHISTEDAKKYEQRKSLIKGTIRTHILVKLCKQYEQTVMAYFKKQIDGQLVDKTRDLVSQLHMGIKTEEDIVHTMAGLGDCEEIIQWYLFFIDAKLQRALDGKMEDEIPMAVGLSVSGGQSLWRLDAEGSGSEEEYNYQKDSDGSAKIAIIAIERSMGAWIRIHELLPHSEDISLKALSLLSQLKQKALEEFPQAMNFKRPGFDD